MVLYGEDFVIEYFPNYDIFVNIKYNSIKITNSWARGLTFSAAVYLFGGVCLYGALPIATPLPSIPSSLRYNYNTLFLCYSCSTML